MKNEIVVCIIILVLLLGGCGDGRLAEVADQLAFPTEVNTRTPADESGAGNLLADVPATTTTAQNEGAPAAVPASATGQPSTATAAPPTAEPSPSPTPTPTPPPTPTPTPPSPEAILDLALHLLDTVESYHFAFSAQRTGAGHEPQYVSFAGDYVAPYTLSGETSLDPGGDSVSSRVVYHGAQYYEAEPDGENWRFYRVDPGHLARSDLDALWGHASELAQAFSSLAYEGIEVADGRSFYVLSGRLDGSSFDPPAEGDVAVEMRIGVEDGYLHHYAITYEESLPDLEEPEQVQESYHFSAFNQPVEIDIPDVAIADLAHEEAALGLVYQAPGDWTIERSGEGCAQGSCPEITLYRDRPGGPHSTVTLALLSQAERPFLEEVMTPPDYEETELAGLPARLREGEAYVDGLLYPDSEHVLQLSARWEGYPHEEAAVWQILDSLASTIPPPADGFVRHTLPGWGSIDIPEGWHFVNPPEADLMVFSSADVDFTYDAGPDDALVIVQQMLDIYRMPLIFLKDEFLPSIEYDWEAIEGPKSVTIGDYAAATITYHGFADYIDSVTAIKTQDGRFILFYATAGEDAWPTYEPLLNAMRDSIQLSSVAESPQLEPVASRAEGTIDTRDEEQGFSFGFPETWQVRQEETGGIVTNYLLTPPDAAEDEIALVKVYPPSTFIVGEDSAQEQLTALGQLDALANWSGDLTIRDAMRTSWTSVYRTPVSEYAASYYVATKDGRPIYGLMGAMTDGDLAVRLIGWFEDPYKYREEVLAIFNSIYLTAAPDLQRETAEPLPVGERFEGLISGPEDQYFTFEANSGQEFLLLSHLNLAVSEGGVTMTSGFSQFDTSVFDPEDSAVVFQPAIGIFRSGMDRFIAEDSGTYVVAIRPFDYYGPIAYTLYLLPVAEGEPGTVDVASGTIFGSCMGFSYLDFDGDGLAVYAYPQGPQARETTLTVLALDSAGNTLYECGENCAETGQSNAFVLNDIGDAGVTISVCELNDQLAEFELLVVALPE